LVLINYKISPASAIFLKCKETVTVFEVNKDKEDL